MLFTTRHSLEAFKEALPGSLEVVEEMSFKRSAKGVFGFFAGETPWGLADIAVVRPVVQGHSRAMMSMSSLYVPMSHAVM